MQVEYAIKQLDKVSISLDKILALYTQKKLESTKQYSKGPGKRRKRQSVRQLVSQ